MGEICPLTNLPCDHVGSCDELMALQFGSVPPMVCSKYVIVAGGRKK